MARHLSLPLAAWLFVCLPALCSAQTKTKPAPGKAILEPGQTLEELQVFVERRLPTLPAPATPAAWDKEAQRLREEMFTKVVYRGEAARWRDAKLGMDWQETLPGGPGYRLKKVRFEALPGMWIPAMLYEPEKLTGKVATALSVMGHERDGKDVPHQQTRCINLAKRGMLVLNVEWFMFGQLNAAGNNHGAMNQLDLCGTSGLAPFYLAQKRALDVLLAHPNADPKRVAVSGLSGGGWQTIYISSLDTRVTLANPVAGYSSFRTRTRYFQDLGDSEQTPCDMATVADYDHLTAMMAPRATLLTYNGKDDCCFVAANSLPPLLECAGPFFQLYDRRHALRSHINTVPGTHNFDKDNRQAFYRMIGEHFFPGDKSFSAEDIDCAGEVRKRQELFVTLPKDNATFNSLALDLAKSLPRQAALPKDKTEAAQWQTQARADLAKIVRYKKYDVKAELLRKESKDGTDLTSWRIRLGNDWTIPAVDADPGGSKGVILRLQDERRASALTFPQKRVVAVDPFYFGETQPGNREYLWALMIGTVGERPLGVQASQVAAVARWLKGQRAEPVRIHAEGPRTSVIALVAAALEPDAIQAVEVHRSLGSLKEILEKNRTFIDMPELFCFGLLEQFDIKHLAALAAPRPVRFAGASERVRGEMADLVPWYRTWEQDVDPFK